MVSNLNLKYYKKMFYIPLTGNVKIKRITNINTIIVLLLNLKLIKL